MKKIKEYVIVHLSSEYYVSGKLTVVPKTEDALKFDSLPDAQKWLDNNDLGGQYFKIIKL